MQQTPSITSALAANDRVGDFLAHYGLREQPFGVTPDPSFLFSSRMHRTALHSMMGAVESNLGFTVLLADPGMGKTTLLFQVLTHYSKSARTAFIFQTQCTRRDLLRHLASEFELPDENHDEVALHRSLKDMLVHEATAGRKVIIVVDEAQNLHISSLEAIRLLSDFETSKAKLLHIILAGSSRLSERLQSPELLPLSHRISTVCRLEPLSPDEVKAYVVHRLRVAGCKENDVPFSPDALAEIAWHSAGVPRLINSICYGALSLAFTLGKREVGKELVQYAARNLDLSCPSALIGDVPGIGKKEFTGKANPPARNEEGYAADSWPAAPGPDFQPESAGPQQVTREDPEANHPLVNEPEPKEPARKDPELKELKRREPEPVPVTSFGHEPVLRVHRRNPPTVGDRGIPSEAAVYRLDRHTILSRLRNRKGELVTVSIAALGILALALWVGWYDPRAKSEVPAAHATGDDPGAAAAPSQYPASTNDASTDNMDQSSHVPGTRTAATEQRHKNLARLAEEGIFHSSRTVPPTSAVETSAVRGSASKLHRPDSDQVELPGPNSSGNWDLPSNSSSNLSQFVIPPSQAIITLEPPAGPNVGPQGLGKPIKVVKPLYPKMAELRRVEGNVLLELQVDPTGRVRNVRAIYGDTMLKQAAEEAARQWQYPPFSNPAGEMAVTQVQFNFKLNPGASDGNTYQKAERKP